LLEYYVPEQSILLVFNPSIPFSNNNNEIPFIPSPPVLTATVKKSEYIPAEIHFLVLFFVFYFSPFTM
jgi:hypothetical protein